MTETQKKSSLVADLRLLASRIEAMPYGLMPQITVEIAAFKIVEVAQLKAVCSLMDGGYESLDCQDSFWCEGSIGEIEIVAHHPQGMEESL